MAPEIHLILHPSTTYRRIAAPRVESGAVVLLRRPLLVCLTLGVSVALAATGRVTAGLVLGAAACWSLVPAVQMAAFATMMRFTPRPRQLPFSSAADLFFMGHLGWSLWLLAVAGAAAATFPAGAAWWPQGAATTLLGTALVPAIVTLRITAAYCREVFGLSERRALLATALYEGLVWGFGVLYAGWAIQLWPRILAL